MIVSHQTTVESQFNVAAVVPSNFHIIGIPNVQTGVAHSLVT